MIEFINKVTNSKIKYLVITHHPPDHSLGISKFLEIGAKVIISKSELNKYYKFGNRFIIQMKKLIGEEWFENTSIQKFEQYNISYPYIINLGEREINIILFKEGHSGGDVAVMDNNTKTFFAGDLVFNERAPTSPHANIPNWINYIEQIANDNWSILVPGHGPVIKDKHKLNFTKKWIEHIHRVALEAAKKGLSPAEVLESGIPDYLYTTNLAKETWNRDIPVLMKKYEKNF